MDYFFFFEALIFGKANASPGITRNQSIGMEWSDSDSSIDSMPDSDSDLEGDWPEQTGFVVCVCVCVVWVGGWVGQLMR